MKAVVVEALSDDLSGVALCDVAPPSRGAGQLLVRVRAAALNHPDLLMTRGRYQLKPPLPFVPGMEMAGEVVEADAGSDFAPGDRVACATRLGAFAELVVCDARAARRVPERVSNAHAAAIGVTYLTAHVALARLGELTRDQWLLVHGATGGVGLAAVELGLSLGARVIATSRSQAKLDVVAAAHPEAITRRQPDFAEEVKRITGGGADLVIDPVGGDVFDETLRCTAFGGRIVVAGFTSGRIATLPTNIALIRDLSVIGVRAGEFARRFPSEGAAHADAVWRMAAEGRLHPHVDATFPLTRWRDALVMMATAAHVGKIVLVPDGPGDVRS